MSLSVSRPDWMRVTCNQCGAPLEVPSTIQYVTCADCGTTLKIQRHGRAVYSEAYEPPASSASSSKGKDAPADRPAVVPMPKISAPTPAKAPPAIVPEPEVSAKKPSATAQLTSAVSSAFASVTSGKKATAETSRSTNPPAPAAEIGSNDRKNRRDALAFAAFFCILWFALSTSIGSPSLIFTAFWIFLGTVLLSVLLIGVWTHPGVTKKPPVRRVDDTNTDPPTDTEATKPEHSTPDRMFPKSDSN